MPAKAKSSPVLIVFLVVFVLLSIILGVTTYLGFSAQTDLTNEAKKNEDEKNKWQKDADFYHLLAIAYKAYDGLPLSKEEQEAIGPLRSGFNSGQLVNSSRAKDKEENVKAIRENLDKNLGWDPATNRPVKSLSDEIDQLKKDLATATKNWEAAKDAQKKAETSAAGAQKELEKARADFADALDKQKKKADDDLAKYVAEIAQRDKDKADLGKQIETLRTEMAQREGESSKKIESFEKQTKQMKIANEKLASANNSKVNILDYDHPKGTIYQVDQTGRMPYINLGSADNLKPGITFSVYAPGPDGKPITYDVYGPDGKPAVGADGKPEKEGKATLEVTNILGDHLAQARVTSLRDEGKDPIMRGDLLFNPGWDPNARQHVAITGLVDLTGEGRDDMNEFVRNLQRQGVIVDAYLDLKDLTIKGKGIDRQTDYLILGPVPITGDPTREDKRRDTIVKEMSDMQQKATENGVTLISLRKFLALSGYHVPRGAGLQSTANVNSPGVYSGGSSAPAGKEAPAPKEAPKDKPDMDKEK